MIWDRERYIAHSLFEDTGREMFCELFGPLHVTEKEWRAQGATDAEINMTAFDWDYVPTVGLSGDIGARTGFAGSVTVNNDELMTGIDRYGRRYKLVKQTATIPLPQDYPVAGADDWLARKHWYEFTEARVDRDALSRQKQRRDNGALSVLVIPGAFDEPRQLMGEEGVCLACYEAPELLHDMLDTFAETAERVLERVGEMVRIDCVHVHEDMAGKSGPLFGPAQIREFFKPYYSRVWAAAKACGARLFSMDSDGDMSPILGELIDCGINCIHPMEPVGGNDIVALRQKYGKKLCFKGGINKFALLHGPEAVRRELEYRLAPGLRGGGTIFALDHRIPNGVPLETYRYYVALGRELLGLGPVSGTGWARMAF